MVKYDELGIDNVDLDYRELRQIVNKTHDRFSEINFDESLSLLQKVNLLAEHFKTVLKDFQTVVDYLDKFIDEFDENLYTTLEDILDEWTESGKLGQLLNDTVLKEIKDEIVNKRDKNVKINMSDLDEDVKLSMTGGSVAVVGSQGVDFPNLNPRIQKDVGKYTDINFDTTFGGWNDDGSENNDSYPTTNYLRSQFLCSSGENIIFKLNTTYIKKFIIQDEKNKVLRVIETKEKFYELNTPTNAFRIKLFYQNAGSLKPNIKRLEYVGFQRKGKVDVQTINMFKLDEKIQDDIGIFYNINIELDNGGWNADGTKNDSEYALTNYRRFIIQASGGEIFNFLQKTASLKTFIFEDGNSNVINSYSSNSEDYRFSAPNDTGFIKVQYQYSGSILPVMRRLTYDSIASKRYANEKDKIMFDNLYFDGTGYGGHNIQDKHMFKKFQKDTGKTSNINIEWVDGGWNTNGTENNSQYGLDNYTRIQYNVQQEQTGRLLHLEGLWTTSLQVVRTFDKDGKLLQELTFDNQYIIDFEISNYTKVVKIQAYKSVKPQLSHYIYDSVASQKYVNDKLKNVNVDDNSNLPDYYFPYIDNKINKIRDLMLKTNGDIFIYITDTHWGNNMKKGSSIIKYLRKQTDINKVIFGGDIITAYGSHETMLNQNYDFNKTFSDYKLFKDWFPIVGNHDFTIRFKNDGSKNGSTLNTDQTYNLIYKNLESYIKIEHDEMCYYFDNDNSKVRYVFINTQDGKIDETVGWGLTYDVSQKQLNWLSDVALNTDYNIIINGHIPIHEQMPTYSSNMELVRLLFESYNNRTKLEKTLNGKTVNKDFTNSKGKILLYLCGHNHMDKQFNTNNLKHISCGCDALYKDDVFERNPNTITEQIVSVFVIGNDGKINLVRIGAGEDRTL